MVSFYECLQFLASKVTNEIVISSIAGVSREWHHLKGRDGNLYQVYMAGTTAIALGVALALPQRRVIALDTDGSILMGLSILPVVAEQNPPNLIVIVCDNECYEITDRIPTCTASVADLAAMAKGAGIRNVKLIRELPEFESALNDAFKGQAASFIVAKVQVGHQQVPFTVMHTIENKYRLVRYIEATENIQVIRPPIIKKL